MDIFNKVNKLPYYLYVFDERQMILGGHSTQDNKPYMDTVYQMWKQIKELYDKKEELSDGEKALYGKLVHRMAIYCEMGTSNRKELKEKIDSLTLEERKDMEWQIEMYEQGRKFYRK